MDCINKSLVLFDGKCNLCNWFVRFIVNRDLKEKFIFASIQSDGGGIAIEKLGLNSKNIRTIILIEENKSYIKSSAILRIARELRGFWSVLYLFTVIPRPIRDFFYDVVVRYRFRWFGVSKVCWEITGSSTPETRFLKHTQNPIDNPSYADSHGITPKK